MTYAVVIEQTDRNFAAYVLDLPGCVATGTTVEEVEDNIHAAIAIHIGGFIEDNVPVPTPRTSTVLVEV